MRRLREELPKGGRLDFALVALSPLQLPDPVLEEFLAIFRILHSAIAGIALKAGLHILPPARPPGECNRHRDSLPTDAKARSQ